MKATKRRTIPEYGQALLALIFAVATAISGSAQSFAESLDREAGATPRVRFWAGKGDMQLASIEVDGLKREYYIYRPAGNHTYPLPTLFAFHGHGGTARGMDKFTGGISELADKEGFLLVFPDGIKRSWLDGREANGKPPRDDVKFISSLIDHLVTSKLADSHRVYVCGMSNGGFFSQYLALKIPDKLAGMVSVGASLATVHDNLKSGKPIPMMYILGTRDPLVPWDGGKIGFKRSFEDRGQCVPAPRAISYWLENNGLTSSSQSTEQVPNTDKSDRSTVKRTVYSNGSARSDMVVYQVDGGGHTWPGGQQYLPAFVIGRTNRDINANEAIWDFLKGHQI